MSIQHCDINWSSKQKNPDGKRRKIGKKEIYIFIKTEELLCVYECVFKIGCRVGGKKLLILKDLETLSKFSSTAEIISFNKKKVLLHKSVCY